MAKIFSFRYPFAMPKGFRYRCTQYTLGKRKLGLDSVGRRNLVDEVYSKGVSFNMMQMKISFGLMYFFAINL